MCVLSLTQGIVEANCFKADPEIRKALEKARYQTDHEIRGLAKMPATKPISDGRLSKLTKPILIIRRLAKRIGFDNAVNELFRTELVVTATEINLQHQKFKLSSVNSFVPQFYQSNFFFLNF